jgi:8-oxo-dGTP pyrophosphatase MutT (NUDIX family)
MSKLKKLLKSLYFELDNQLPGETSHLKMAPYKRANAKEVLSTKITPRLASTLLLLHEKNNSINFTLIKRPNYNGTHGGQISFPGGKLEENETIMEAAIRETEEEIGISKESINLLGQLTQVYIPPSNFLITPFIGFLDAEPNYFPDAREVERIIDIPISELLDESLVKKKKISVDNYGKDKFYIDAPYYELQNSVVWGATALVLSEFKDILTKIS